jgi:imidazoleglycerol phosphate dehydratase HisB
MYTPMTDTENRLPRILEENVSKGNISVEARSAEYARVSRQTAESIVTVGVDFPGKTATGCHIQSPCGISLDPFCKLLTEMAAQAGFTIQVDFESTMLASSHVVLEDTGLVLGRALKEILIQRMVSVGATGSGDSFEHPEDFDNQPVRVGISVEGRKFWRLLPFEETYDQLKKRFIIGQTVLGSIYSEDLDDFLDGLSGGMDASIMIHLKEPIEADTGWQLIFSNLGKALRGVFEVNAYRKGVPPGVKATLE